MAGSDAQKSSNKPISEYFPKRAPSSPVRGGTKSPLSFGSMYPQSPKTSYVASSPSGNASNGPMSYNQGDYYQQHPQQPGGRAAKSSEAIQTDLTMAEITKRSADLDTRNNRIDELQRVNDEMSRHLTGRNKELEASKSTITKCLSVVKELLIEKSRIGRKDARAKCMQNRLRLGQFVTQRVGATFQENWTNENPKIPMDQLVTGNGMPMPQAFPAEMGEIQLRPLALLAPVKVAVRHQARSQEVLILPETAGRTAKGPTRVLAEAGPCTTGPLKRPCSPNRLLGMA